MFLASVSCLDSTSTMRQAPQANSWLRFVERGRAENERSSFITEYVAAVSLIVVERRARVAAADEQDVRAATIALRRRPTVGKSGEVARTYRRRRRENQRAKLSGF